MSLQTGSTRGHHLANYHCWHNGADLNCHHKHITPCPNCPAICHRATRRATQHAEDGAEGDSPHDKATWLAPQTGHTTGPPAPLTFGGHSAVSQCQLTVSVTSWLTRLYCVFDIYFLWKRWKKGGSTCSTYKQKITGNLPKIKICMICCICSNKTIKKNP